MVATAGQNEDIKACGSRLRNGNGCEVMKMTQIRRYIGFALLGLVLFAGRDTFVFAADQEPVSFGRDIRPILSDVCFKCHGPDEQQRVSDFRLDTRAGAFADLETGHAIVAGNLDASLLARRISSTDPEIQMPPADSGRSLSKEQISLLRRWIEQGAVWQEHWAFLPPQRTALPALGDPDWISNPIDAFVLARLEAGGLAPSEAATRSTLIRRVTIDLTGLPPTLEEVEHFLADDAPDAYERVVDRLLSSGHFGERMGLVWLDAARYADTSGYQNDGPRSMWRWRDWVIDAFNANMPFDQFTIEQLAGDLLPEPTLQQRIATGFNRNHRGNAEGGIIPEEYQVEYVVDRVDTTFTVWLSLTIGCARCHDHKYDPLKQSEFYQVAAFFNNVPESGRAIKEGNSPPFIKAPTAAQSVALRELDVSLSAADQRVRDLREAIGQTQLSWEQQTGELTATPWSLRKGLVAHFPFDGNLIDAKEERRGGRFEKPGGGFVSGKLDQAAGLDGQTRIDGGDVGDFGYFDAFAVSAWIYPTENNGTILSRMTPTPRGSGYYLHLEEGRIQVNLVKRWLDDSIRVETEQVWDTGRWYHVVMSYDGSRVAAGIRVFVDGQPVKLLVHLDGINQSFASTEPLRVGGGHSSFAGKIDEVRVYNRDLESEEVALLATPSSIAEILAIATEKRSERQRRKLRTYFVEHHAPEAIQQAVRDLDALRDRRAQFWKSVPTVMVMEEMPVPRATHVLVRGQYDKPGERVEPGVPAVFPPLPEGNPANRLGFARWLVSPAHPLTARVAVNRFWQLYFGDGLVKTSEDFGSQGARPSHSRLLDWLAVEFMDRGWDVKALQRRIVESETYRQSSHVTPAGLARDPENRLFSRGPRFRLSAEMIRDQALAVSGLLHEEIGGPSVRPYQPAGLWKEIASDTDYQQSHEGGLYRRSMYTYWKRTVAPPTMMTLDATAREACTVKRSRTNTPLQSLALMNDVTFVEAARVLAQRVMQQVDDGIESRLTRMFRLATARKPNTQELQVLMKGWQHYLNEFQQRPEDAQRLVSTGEFGTDAGLEPVQLAAYTAVASMVLNLDEVVTKQ